MVATVDQGSSDAVIIEDRMNLTGEPYSVLIDSEEMMPHSFEPIDCLAPHLSLSKAKAQIRTKNT